MPTLLFIRHGENDYLKHNRLAGHLPGIHLNQQGRQQAEKLAQALADASIKAIYSSPLERAVETAEPLARAHRLDVRLRPGLMDTDVGDWADMEIRKLRKNPLWKLVQESPSRVRFPGGESFLELQARLVNEIEAIRAAHRPKDVVAVVFHADPIKVVVAHYIGLPLDHIQKLNVGPGSVTVLSIGAFGAHLIALNLKPPFEFKS
jgi:probable phosphomutase (TIGR03848 family)